MKRVDCSVKANLELVKASRADYENLSRFHYRDCSLGPYAAAFALKDTHHSPTRKGCVAGVIVYTMAAPNLELRNIALGDVFSGLGRGHLLEMINRNVRCISRVIIEPRYRGIGLASMLVRKTLGLVDVPIVEAMAVMGRVNPFFEKAGMKSYSGSTSVGAAKLREAFGAVGIEEDMFIDSWVVHEKICGMDSGSYKFINQQISRFLQAYGKRRYMEAGPERIRYVLSKLTYRPMYYIWQNNSTNGICYSE